jgi:hypothetical protein
VKERGKRERERERESSRAAVGEKKETRTKILLSGVGAFPDLTLAIR